MAEGKLSPQLLRDFFAFCQNATNATCAPVHDYTSTDVSSTVASTPPINELRAASITFRSNHGCLLSLPSSPCPRLATNCIISSELQDHSNLPPGIMVPGWRPKPRTITIFGCRSYVAKTTEQLEHALAAMDALGVELRAADVVGVGSVGAAMFDREVERVREEVITPSFELSLSRTLKTVAMTFAPVVLIQVFAARTASVGLFSRLEVVQYHPVCLSVFLCKLLPFGFSPRNIGSSEIQ